MAKLNEIRSSNLNKLKNSTFSKAAKNYPKELLRLLFQMFEGIESVEIDNSKKEKAINDIERNIEDSMTDSSWWLDANNSREIIINDDIKINLDPRNEFLRIDVAVLLFIKISFKFEYSDTVGDIFGTLINFTKDVFERTGGKKVGMDEREEIRKELKSKYKPKKKSSFIESIRRIFNKYGFYFKIEKEFSYKFNYQLNNNGKLPTNFVDKLENPNLPFKINILQSKLFPVLFKKIENNNYLLKDYRILNNYFYIALTTRKENEKYHDMNVTYGERHKRVKSVMMARNEEKMAEGREEQKEILKELLEWKI